MANAYKTSSPRSSPSQIRRTLRISANGRKYTAYVSRGNPNTWDVEGYIQGWVWLGVATKTKTGWSLCTDTGPVEGKNLNEVIVQVIDGRTQP